MSGAKTSTISTARTSADPSPVPCVPARLAPRAEPTARAGGVNFPDPIDR